MTEMIVLNKYSCTASHLLSQTLNIYTYKNYNKNNNIHKSEAQKSEGRTNGTITYV